MSKKIIEKTCNNHKEKLILQYSNMEINSFFCKICKKILSFGYEENYKSVIPYEKIEGNSDNNIFLIYEKMRKFVYNTYNYKEDFLEYELERKEAIDFLSKLGMKYKISEDCMYSAILYMDIIANDDKNVINNLDLYAIGCFFLAGKKL